MLLILGIGNSWASDDGVGPEVVRRAQARLQEEGRDQMPAVEFKTMTQPDLGLLDLLPRCETLIVVDAVVSGAPAGTLHRELWRPGVLDTRGVERASSHGFGVREMLDMAVALNKLPQRVELWGIEIASTEAGKGLSKSVTESLPEIICRLVQQLRVLMVEWDSRS